MVSKLPALSVKARPISVKEFLEALLSTWDPAAQKLVETTVGLAISGGADSMALASLCSKAMHQNLTGLRFRGFIVDHGARAGSGEEAQAVSEVLREKGIPSKILKVEWPKGMTPLQSTNFESMARKYRFQALGRACKDSNVHTLLLAHHGDDQAETVMMRMVRGQRRIGLSAIKDISQIPECYGIHGVCQSGSVDGKALEDKMARKSKGLSHSSGSARDLESSTQAVRLTNDDQVREITENFAEARIREVRLQDNSEPMQVADICLKSFTHSGKLGPMPLEYGGIKVLRPFLSFSKERLVATCVEDGTPWFEDSTNADPTITQRNAVRHIFKKHLLPAALQKHALLALSERLRRRDEWLKTEARSLLRDSLIRTFEPRAGTLTIRFANPSFPSTSLFLKLGSLCTTLSFQRELASALLKFVIEYVTPEEHVHISSLSVACKTVFPNLSPESDQQTGAATSFNIAGVRFKRLDLHESIPMESELVKSTLDKEQSHKGKSRLQDHEWFITRQPHHSKIWQRPLLKIPSVGTPGKPAEWSLYDGRYWIRLINYSPNVLAVRPFCKDDLKPFRTALGEHTRRNFLHRLKTLAPGDIKFTLPAIVAVPTSGPEQVLALPTLEVGIPGVERLLDFEVRYKQATLPTETKYEELMDGPRG